jgi:N-acetylglucosamine-6-phosphate deacetylase
MSDSAHFVGRIVMPDGILEHGCVEVHDGFIVAVQPGLTHSANARIVDLTGKYVCPGFIDLHVHGGLGADFMDGTCEAIELACRAHLAHGTTTIFPTTTTGSPQQILAMMGAARQVATHNSAEPLPRIPGVHLYGPFFAEDKVGCHSTDGRRSPTRQEYEQYFQTGFVSIATCAAELQHADQFYEMAREHQCLITCGHSNANWAEMQRAFELGMRHVDHFWCAMSSVQSLRPRFGTPMQASMTEFVLMNREMSTEVIADGHHLSPELLEFAYRMIGPDRLCLVTDCNRAMGMPPGKYRFGNEQDGSWLLSNGEVGLAANGNGLASSIVGMDHMIREMTKATSATLPEVIRMATLTPAQRAGVNHEVGSIEVGKLADLVVLNNDLEIERVFLKGTEVKTLVF